MGDLDAMKGASWSPSGVLRDVLPDVPRPTLSRDDPSVETEEERPVPRNMKITQNILKMFGYTPGCANCRKLSRNEYFHPSLAHSQDCSIRIEAASKADPTYRDRVSERWISTRKWNRWIMQGELPWNRVLHRDHQLQRLKLKTAQVFGRTNGLVKSQHKICQ